MKLRILAGTLAALAVLPFSFGAAEAQTRTRVGLLACNIAPGVGLIVVSQRALNCTFVPSTRGPRHRYIGRIGRVGLDVGVTGPSRLAWAVYAPTRVFAPGQLAGTYAGAGAEATLALGLGANVLVGGSRDTVALQPLSVQAQTGVNLAIGVTGLTLARVVRR